MDFEVLDDSQDKQKKKVKEKKRILKKIKKFKMPKNKLLVFPNPDKGFHESWTKSRSMLNFPVPFRCMLIGTANSGKSTIVTNLILAQGMDKKKGENQPFEEVYIIHYGHKDTKEYKKCGAKFLKDIPNPSSWNVDKKKLLILEDLSYKDMSLQQKEALKRCWAYVSTHKNLSCIMTLQDFFDCDCTLVRRCTNLFVLFPTIDKVELSQISRKIGLKKGELEILFDKYCKSGHDSLWLDLTENGRSPYPIRINGFLDIGKK